MEDGEATYPIVAPVGDEVISVLSGFELNSTLSPIPSSDDESRYSRLFNVRTVDTPESTLLATLRSEIRAPQYVCQATNPRSRIGRQAGFHCGFAVIVQNATHSSALDLVSNSSYRLDWDSWRDCGHN